MRREKSVCKKLEAYLKQVDAQGESTVYQRGVINTLRWVLGELEDV